MPAVAIRKVAAPCARCGQTIPRGARFTWGKGGAFHPVGECPSPTAPELPLDTTEPEMERGPEPEPEPEPEKKKAAPKPAPITTAPAAEGGIIGALEQAIRPSVDRIVRETLDLDKTRDDLMAEARTEIKTAVREAIEALTVPITVQVATPSGEVKTLSNVHRLFPRLLDLAQRRRHAYLWGPPGSGKSTAAEQVSKALSLDYGYVSLNAQTSDYILKGYPSPTGEYIASQFFRIYTGGGVFCIDELDNSSANLLTTLNGMIENGHGSFPHGLFQRHPDFILVATGNTPGRGGDVTFPERRVFDAATADRFAFVPWGYDEALESTLTMAANPKAGTWLQWVRSARAYCQSNRLRVFATPRAAINGAGDLAVGITTTECAESYVFKGCAEEIKSKILSACPLPSPR